MFTMFDIPLFLKPYPLEINIHNQRIRQCQYQLLYCYSEDCCFLIVLKF